MAFWNLPSVDPTRKFRFLMQSNGIESDQWIWAKSINKPSYEINTGEYQLGNHKFKYPGIATWNDITITIVLNSSLSYARSEKVTALIKEFLRVHSSMVVPSEFKIETLTSPSAFTAFPFDMVWGAFKSPLALTLYPDSTMTWLVKATALGDTGSTKERVTSSQVNRPGK